LIKLLYKNFVIIKKNILNDFVIGYFEISPYEKIGTICISYNVMAYLIEYMFGGQGLNCYSKTLFKNLTLSESNIIKKLFNVILQEYCNLWNKTLFCKIKFNLNYLKNVDKIFDSNFSDDNKIFTNFLFHTKIGTISGLLNINFPIKIFYLLQNELKKKKCE